MDEHVVLNPNACTYLIMIYTIFKFKYFCQYHIHNECERIGLPNAAKLKSMILSHIVQISDASLAGIQHYRVWLAGAKKQDEK